MHFLKKGAFEKLSVKIFALGNISLRGANQLAPASKEAAKTGLLLSCVFIPTTRRAKSNRQPIDWATVSTSK